MDSEKGESSEDVTPNINDLCPEIFQIIITNLLLMCKWRHILPLRLVSKYWKSNIDSHLSTTRTYRYARKNYADGRFQKFDIFKLSGILKFFPNLKELILKDVIVSENVVTVLSQRVPKLQRLDLSGCHGISDSAIRTLSVQFTQLKSIDVSYCGLKEEQMSLLLKNLQNLEELHAQDPNVSITWKCLENLGPKIKSLMFGFNPFINLDFGIGVLVAGNGKNLEHLCIEIQSFQKINLKILTENLRQLRSFKLIFNSFGEGPLQELAIFKMLESLVLVETSFGDKTVITDQTLIPILKGCSKLRFINLSGYKISRRIGNTLKITNYFVESILRLCPRIKSIKLSGAHALDDNSLILMAKMPFLTRLHLLRMDGITDQGIIKFVQESKTIRNFQVKNCSKITENVREGWIELARLSPEERLERAIKDLEERFPNSKSNNK